MRGARAPTCSCPDSANPCKHIAAVYYLLGEEFDRDPFLIFRLRGMAREELLRILDEMEEAAHPTARDGDATEGDAGARSVDASTPLAAPNASFWRAGAVPDDVFPERIAGEHPGALLLRLGAFPFWRGPEPLDGRASPRLRARRDRGPGSAGRPDAQELSYDPWRSVEACEAGAAPAGGAYTSRP